MFERLLAQPDGSHSGVKREKSYQAGINMEADARAYLKKQGLKHKCSNFRIRGGEIDLIMQDGNTLVFVEVKYRHSHEYGTAKEAINIRKQLTVRKTAEFYLKQHYPKQWPQCRFDAVCIQGELQNIEWIKNAF